MSLEPCPSSPNCISSQADPADEQHFMAPVSVSGAPSAVIDAVAAVLRDASGAEVKSQAEARVDAVFTTRILRFKDDVAFVVENGHLHFRSASRTGHSDLGANRKRLEALLPQITARL